MLILFKRIMQVCEKRHISCYALEKGALLTKSSIRYWEDSMPSGDKILRVANFLDVSVDYLLGNSDNPLSHKNDKELSSSVDELVSFVSMQSEAIAKVGEANQAILTKYKALLRSNEEDLSE